MAYIPDSGSVVAFQSNPANLQASVTGTVAASLIGVSPVNLSNVTVTGGALRTYGSISGTAGASVIGSVPVRVEGSVANVIIGGSIAASFTPPANQSVSGTVTTNQGTTPWVITGSIQGSFSAGNSSVQVLNFPANQSVSGTVGASLIGLSPVSVSNFPTTQNVSGSVVATQGTNPWIITGSVQSAGVANQSVSGTVGASIIGTVPVTQSGAWVASVSGTVGASIIGTVPVVQSGTQITSISGAITASIQGNVQVASLISMPGIISTANSSTSNLGAGAAFTGTSEEVKDFGSIVISIFADQNSGTDGLSIQQSSNGTNWDITDTYTIAANTGRTFQVQPAARFFRIVYTNGGTPQTAFRLQTIYHPQMVKPTSQRAADNYTNETDLEQNQVFGMVFNGTNWDRVRGNSSVGALVSTANQSVMTIWQSPSIVGTYVEDAAHSTGDRGVMHLGVRNDTVASFVGTNLDYTPHAVDSAGRIVTKPFAPDQASVIALASLSSAGSTVGSIVVMVAPGPGLKNYLTDFNISNTGAATTLVTFAGGDTSIIGRTIAPSGGGSNHSFAMPLTTVATNVAITAQLSAASSVVHIAVTGYKAP